WGGYKDAGDNDRRIESIPLSVGLLTLYEVLPITTRGMALDVASLKDVLPDSIYNGVELPDLVEEALWNLDLFRRMQDVSTGGCRGHVQQADDPEIQQPPWLETDVTYATGPCHVASFYCAAGFAKAAVILKSLGQTAVAAVYEDAAIKAWNFAEPIYT